MQITKHYNGKKYLAIRKDDKVDVRIFIEGSFIGSIGFDDADCAFEGISWSSRNILQSDRDFAAKVALLLFSKK